MVEGARFVAAVEAIYASAVSPANWPMALRSFADVFGDEHAILTFGPEGKIFRSISSAANSGDGGEMKCSAVAREAARHLDVRCISRNHGSIQLDRIAKLMESSVQITQSDRISDLTLCQPCQILTTAAGKSFHLFLQRHRSKPKYTNDEIEAYGELCRHTGKALTLTIAQQDAELEIIAMQQAMDRLGIGYMALDRLRRVVLSNPKADQIIKEFFLINEASGLSIPGNRDFEKAISSILLRDIVAISRQIRPIRLLRSNAKRSVILYLRPVGENVPIAKTFLASAQILVLLVDAEPNEPADPETVRDILQLTLGEAKVASLVGSGLSPRDAAIILKISEHTARTVLKRVFAKTGIERQSELVVLLNKLILR